MTANDTDHRRPTNVLRGGVPTSRAAIRRGPLPILTAALLWGSNGLVGSLAPADSSAVAVGAAGMAFGGFLLLFTTNGVREFVSSRSRRDLLTLAIGALGVAGYPLCFYPSVARGGVAVPTVIAMGSAPIFAGLLGWAFHRSRPPAAWVAATFVAVVGCAALVLGRATSGNSPSSAGFGLAALAGLSYATYSLIGGHFIGRGHGSAPVMATTFGGAAVIVSPVLIFTDSHWLTTGRGVSVALELALVTTFLAYRLFGSGLRYTSPQVATTLTLAEPAMAALVGVCLLGERLPVLSWLGMGLLGLGLVSLVCASRRTG
ncbi:DMT family transporter [Kribbella sp. NPDC055071]